MRRIHLVTQHRCACLSTASGWPRADGVARALACLALAAVSSARAQLSTDPSYVRQPQRQSQFEGHILKTSAGTELAFALFDPKPAAGNTAPLVIALHDAPMDRNGPQVGESRAWHLVGDRGGMPAERGWSAFVAVPIAKDGWIARAESAAQEATPSGAPTSPAAGPGGTRMYPEIAELVDALLAKYPIDPKRVIVYGFGAGGDAAVLVAAEQPDRFAAMVVGWPRERWAQAAAPRVAGLPTLVIVRDRPADRDAPRAVQHLIDAGNPKVEFVYMPMANREGFRSANVLRWMTDQRRP